MRWMSWFLDVGGCGEDGEDGIFFRFIVNKELILLGKFLYSIGGEKFVCCNYFY